MEENMQGESSMDEKAFLLQEIRYSKRKQNVKSSCAMKAQELPQVEPSPWCWKDVRCLSLFIRCMCGLFWQFYVVRLLEGFIR